MHLVQILLPLVSSDGTPRPRRDYVAVAEELVARFGGVTQYHRAPAKGVWTTEEGRKEDDDIVVYEVMVGDLDLEWWRSYRNQLETRFEQKALVVRALAIEAL